MTFGMNDNVRLIIDLSIMQRFVGRDVSSSAKLLKIGEVVIA